MAGRLKHMERSHRSYHDRLRTNQSGLTKVANVAQKKQSIFAKFKERLTGKGGDR